MHKKNLMTHDIRRLLAGSALPALFLYLIAPRMRGKPDRTPFSGVHYAHRGLFDNSGSAPENSLPAFALAVEHGYGIELDVQLSKDGVPVVFHDASLKRMCGIDGNVWEYTLAELQQMKLAHSDAVIPAFAEVLTLVDGRVPLIVEYKLDVVQTTVCERSDALLRSYRGPYCIESFHPRALRWYRRHRPDVMRGQLSMAFYKDPAHKTSASQLALAFLLTNIVTRPDFIAYHHKDASNLSRRLCRKLGALSVAWTIKSTEEYLRANDQFDLFIFDSCRL